MSVIDKLDVLRAVPGHVRTVGLNDRIIEQFSRRDSRLVQAVDEALDASEHWRKRYPTLWIADERTQQAELQARYLNFYAPDAVTPYVPLAGKGPWIITSKGAVVHDSGGYGMLCLGHAPDDVLTAMNREHVMANIMTPSFSHLEFVEALRTEIGHKRPRGCPYERIMCLNSGSEAVTAAARIADANAYAMTRAGGPRAGARIGRLAVRGSFHGRTDRPARYSDSSRKTYQARLASYQGDNTLVTVELNNRNQLRSVFENAEAENVFYEAMFLEPVMGEGNPGASADPAFYDLARQLTREHGTLLLVDSIQAGLRAHGVLSIVDYPGFESLDAPDMEAYSKALNAGQYPLSVLALSTDAACKYAPGLYGNTMTANPRALSVGLSVLSSITPAVRANIVERGKEFIAKLDRLKEDLDGRITGIQGTGLLFSLALDSRHYRAYGPNSTEEYLRCHGVNVIHGGANSLRYTPVFDITSEEVDLIVDATREAIVNGPGGT